MRNLVVIAAFAAAAVSTSASAELTPVGKPIGKWAVFGEADPMTDKKSCIAYYGGQKYVQLTTDSLAVGYGGRGGIQGYTLRFDNDPPLGMELPSDVEKEVSAFLIRGNDPRFAKLLTAKRLRVQTLTLVSGVANDDIDLTDVQAVFTKLRGPECN